MIEVTVDSIRWSMVADYRLLTLKQADAERYLPIYIGPCEADAIAIRLQNRKHPRPLTHDLLNNVISEMGGEVAYIVVNDMRNDTYYARVMVNLDGREMNIDSRPSDAIALAVRTNAPIFVEESVMEQAGITPEVDISASEEEDGEDLSAFREFVNNLDLDDLPIQ